MTPTLDPDRNAWAGRRDTTPIRPHKADHIGWWSCLKYAVPPRPYPPARPSPTTRWAR